MSSVNDMVLVQGMAHTRTALREWNDAPGRVLWPWVGLSFLVACGLLFAVYLVAKAATPQPAVLNFAGLTHPPDLEDYLQDQRLTKDDEPERIWDHVKTLRRRVASFN